MNDFLELVMVFLIVLVIIGIILPSAYHLYMIRKEDKKRLKVFRPPLNWSKESGFNRAPTLEEAELFAVDETGDLVRRKLAQGDNLDEAINNEIPTKTGL